MSDDFEKGIKIGRGIGKSFLKKSLNISEDLFEALYAEYELGYEDLVQQARDAYSLIDKTASEKGLTEELGVAIAMLDASVDQEERQLNTYRIQELAAMKNPTFDMIQDLWADVYHGGDDLIGSMLRGGMLQKAFQDVVHHPLRAPESYPSHLPLAFRHFIMTTSTCLPKDLTDGENETASFYWTGLRTGAVFTSCPPTRQSVAPIQEFLAYQNIQEHGPHFMQGFAQNEHSGLALLTNEFVKKAALYKMDMISRLDDALDECESDGNAHNLGSIVRAKMAGMKR
jgi:hypothetical protein